MGRRVVNRVQARYRISYRGNIWKPDGDAVSLTDPSIRQWIDVVSLNRLLSLEIGQSMAIPVSGDRRHKAVFTRLPDAGADDVAKAVGYRYRLINQANPQDTYLAKDENDIQDIKTEYPRITFEIVEL